MVARVKVGDVELAAREYHQDVVVVVELAEVVAVAFVVDAVHVGVEPHLATAQRGVAAALQSDAVYGFLGQQVALGGASLDGNLGKVALHEDAGASAAGLNAQVEGDLYDLCLAVGVGGEVHYARFGLALGKVVLLVAGDGGNIEALDVAQPALSVAVDDVVDGAAVVLLEHLNVADVLAYEYLFGYADYLVLAVPVEYYDVVDVGTVADELVFLESGAYEAFLPVDVELLVSLYHLCCLYRFKVAYLGAARMVVAVFVLDELEPAYRYLRHAAQVLVDVGYLGLYSGDEIVGFVLAELSYALHLDL